MHIVIDFETLSTRINAVLLEFGWATFEPGGTGIYQSGAFTLDAQSQIKTRHIEWSTIKWWMNQGEEARKKITAPTQDDALSLSNFFDCLYDLPWNMIEGVWSHGATFDIPILSELLLSNGKEVPWKYKQARDTRTLFWLFPVEFVKADVKHSAEHDAIAQALTVQKAMRKMRGEV